MGGPINKSKPKTDKNGQGGSTGARRCAPRKLANFQSADLGTGWKAYPVGKFSANRGREDG